MGVRAALCDGCADVITLTRVNRRSIPWSFSRCCCWGISMESPLNADWLKNARLLHAQKDIECIFPDSHVRPSDAVARNWTCRH